MGTLKPSSAGPGRPPNPVGSSLTHEVNAYIYCLMGSRGFRGPHALLNVKYLALDPVRSRKWSVRVGHREVNPAGS